MRLASIVIALAFAVGAAVSQGGVTSSVVKVWLCLLLPLALIWFSDELGSFTGSTTRGGNIDAETPGFLIALMGWFFLIGLPVLIFVLGS